MTRITLRRALALAVLAVAGTAATTAALAADSLTPASVTLGPLHPGESADVSKSLHLDALPAGADILLAVDTTGSMGGAIAQAKAEAVAIVSDVQASIPNARFAVAHFDDYPFNPFGSLGCDQPYQLHQGFTADAAVVQTAINGLALHCGNDFPESYNRVFYESYSDPALAYDPAALKFLVVLGDAFPHDANLNGDFPACGFNTPPTDPGPDGIVGNADDLGTKETLDGMIANDITLLMVTYNGFSNACHDALATYTGGDGVAAGGGSSLATQIVNLVTSAASTVSSIDIEVSPASFSSWVSAAPAPPYGPFTAPVDLTFTETITVPLGTTAGTYSFDVKAVADGAERAVEHVTVTVVTNEDPDCASATAGGPIWPPNHKYVSRSITGLTDADGDTVGITITGITQDEPLDAPGMGDGNTSPDAVIGSDGSFQVRAERAGTGDGRVYRVSFTGDDGNGGTCAGTVSLGVPHDQSGPAAVDSGGVFSST
jgi:hypothetical protein